jgi:hypothetical protein
MTRDELIIKYKGYCLNEYIKSIQELNLEEQIHFTNIIIRVCHFVLKNDEDYHIYELLEQELYIKYRSKMKYFVDSSFINNFIFNNNGFEKFSKDLSIEDEELSSEEHNELIMELYVLFDHLKTRLYVLDKDSKGFSKSDFNNEELFNAPMPNKKFKTYNTRSQQVLLMYYLNLALEVKVRKEISIVNVAKFYNALFGWEYDDINNSGLYKHFKKDPLAKHNRKELHEHLHWVKDQFTLIGLTDIIKLIDAKILEVEKEIL